ncbi:MAG: head GIN domain-containing protein [Pseudomonadota bacterium]
MNLLAPSAWLRLGAAALLLATAVWPAHALDIRWGLGSSVTGSGKPASETRAPGSFQAISVRGPIELVVRQSGREAVEVRADDNLLPLIETQVEDGAHGPTLVVGVRKGQSLSTRSQIRVTVDVARLQALSTSGSGDFTIESLQTPSLKLSIAGSSDGRIGGLQTESLDIAIAGSGDVRAAGSAARVKLSIAGSGDARLPQLQADDVTVSISGSGDADVTANKTLAVSIAGSGDVVYGGSGTLTRSSVLGSGSVTRR